MSEMTATRMKTLGKLATLLVLAGVGVVAILFLWRSRVPDGLDTDGLRPGSFFSAAQLRKTADYEEFHRVNWVLSTLATLVVFALYAWRGSRFVRLSAAGPIGTGMLLAMLGFALVWLVGLPFEIAGLWWDRRHGVSKAQYWEVIFGGWLGLGAAFLFLSLSVLIVMGLARVLRQWWWIPGSAAFVALFALFVFISPYLVTDAKALDDPELKAAAQRLAEKEGVEDVLPIQVEDVDEYTDAANAYATGFGPSRKVFLWNTLLDGRFSDRQVEFVLAHEFGHHARYHLPKAIGWYALFAIPGAFLIAIATRRRGGMGQPAAVPLSLFVLVVLNTVATPLDNVIGRHMESEADWMALETTRDPAAGKQLFQNFSRTSLGDPDPPTWAYLLFDGHPTLMQRIAMTERWEDQYGG
jgi:STE24 endopeptidase